MKLTVLKNALIQFGLNPEDWSLKIRNHSGSIFNIEISMKAEPGIWFEGQCEQNRWLSLQLSSF